MRIARALLVLSACAPLCSGWMRPPGLAAGRRCPARAGRDAAFALAAKKPARRTGGKGGAGGGFGSARSPGRESSREIYTEAVLQAANGAFADIAKDALPKRGLSFGSEPAGGEADEDRWADVQAGAKPTVVDVYVRSEKDDRLWFVGKVAAGPMTKGACGGAWALRSLLFEHARRLRPEELGRSDAGRNLRIYAAPGNTEIAVAKDEQRLYRVLEEWFDGVALPPLQEGLAAGAFGFQPELYEPGETGFHTRKADDGGNLRAPVKVNFAPPPPL